MQNMLKFHLELLLTLFFLLLFVAPVGTREKSRLSGPIAEVDEDPYGYLAIRDACIKCIMAQGNVPWSAMMCPPCHPAGGDEHKSQWGVGNTTLVLSLLTFIHAAVISVPKLLRKACRIGLNWYWNVPDKEPLEERMGKLENDFVTLKERTSADVEGVEKHIQSDRSRIKRLEDSHSGLKEDKKALHKRVTTLKETLEHKAKVEVGEGVLRQRRQPGKEWSKDEIGGGEGSQ